MRSWFGLRWFCFAFVLLFPCNSVLNVADEALKCIANVDDQSLYRGTQLMMAAVAGRSVVIIDSAGVYYEHYASPSRQIIALFVKDANTVNVFYHSDQGFFGKKFNRSYGDSWTEQMMYFTVNDKDLVLEDVVAENEHYYSYSEDKCIHLTTVNATGCMPAVQKPNHYVFDVITGTIGEVHSSVYNVIGCNHFSEHNGMLKIAYKKTNKCLYNEQSLKFVQFYDKDWDKKSARVCSEIKFSVTITSATANTVPLFGPAITFVPTSDNGKAPGVPKFSTSVVIFGSILGLGILVVFVAVVVIALVLTGKIFAGDSNVMNANDTVMTLS